LHGGENLAIFVYPMKRLTVILFLSFLCIASSAQIVIPEGCLSRKKTSLMVGDTPISSQQKAFLLQDINGENYTDVWEGAEIKYTYGALSMMGGSVLTVAGFCAGTVGITGVLLIPFVAVVGPIDSGQSQDLSDNKTLKTAVRLTVAGGAMTVLGIGLCILGNRLKTGAFKQMDSVIDAYNMSIGPTDNGFGISYKF
jgi:hypothetical protein